MKKSIVMLALLVPAFLISSKQVQAGDWKEKDEFHKVMAATFHPSEEGNFEPIRNRAAEMNEKAMAWAKSTPPAEFDKPEIKATLKELVDGTTALKAMIEKKATNDEIKPKLEALHDTFHKVAGMCSHKDGKGHEGHKEHKE